MSSKLASSKSSVLPLSGATKSSGLNQQSQLSKSSSVNGKMGKSSAVPSASSQPSAKIHSHSSVPRKRPRSESRSESPHPAKRRSHVADDDDNVSESIGSMIWNMFGRNRDEYVSRDIFSDDEDMEADASCVAREEAIRLVILYSSHPVISDIFHQRSHSCQGRSNRSRRGTSLRRRKT